jgi:hypothetical protein
MMHQYFVNIAPIEPCAVVLTIEALPGLLIIGETPDDALRHAREAVSFLLGDAIGSMGRPIVELVAREVGVRRPGYSLRT